MEYSAKTGVRPQARLVFSLTAMYPRDTGKTYSTSFATALLVATIGLALASPRADAQFIKEREVAMLPDYCRHNQAVAGRYEANPAETARDERVLRALGPTSAHIHHYCYGLAYTNRAKLSRMTPQERNHLLGQTIVEFDYVISRAPADFVLLPEILTKRGENLLRLRRVQEAVSTLLRAIETKTDYWPPYAALSDYYKQNGELDKAREWLEKGIAASPGAKALEMRQLELKSKQ